MHGGVFVGSLRAGLIAEVVCVVEGKIDPASSADSGRCASQAITGAPADQDQEVSDFYIPVFTTSLRCSRTTIP